MCIHSSEEEGKLATKTAIIQLAVDICSYDTLECCHGVGYTDEKMSVRRSTAVGHQGLPLYKC